MTTDEKTPQQRLEENPELMDQVTESMRRGREGSVPRPERRGEDPERLAQVEEAESASEAIVSGPKAYDAVPPELRPHRW